MTLLYVFAGITAGIVFTVLFAAVLVYGERARAERLSALTRELACIHRVRESGNAISSDARLHLDIRQAEIEQELAAITLAAREL